MNAAGPTVDFHAHMLESRAVEEGLSRSVATGFGAPMGKPARGTALANPIEASVDRAVHVAPMDRLGIDAEVVSSMT
jgi:hypothetical protein